MILHATATTNRRRVLMTSDTHAARTCVWCALSRNGACPCAMSRMQAAMVLRELRHRARQGLSMLRRLGPGAYQASGRDELVLNTRLVV